LRRLGTLFAEGKVEKLYWAVVTGRPPQDAGRIAIGLKKLSRRGGWRIVVDPDGPVAITDYRVLAAVGRRTWLALRPRTGRTHQIRVHCGALGCPVVGDPVYGGAAGAAMLLHARAIVLPLYPSRPPLLVTAPPPPHIEAALAGLGYDPSKWDREGHTTRWSMPQGALA
jgi:tRNA pseudouridine32 synthase/23S rRNA pseudouridine746 synthase/23S rRNA pseudouridine1911/1915/1917 synthase